MVDVKDMNVRGLNRVVKRYRFDLDQSVSQRWGPILADFKDKFGKLKQTVDNMLNAMGVSDNSWTYYGVKKLVSWYRDSILFRDELEFISKTTGIQFEKLLLMQLLYEASSACSCIVTQVNGQYKFLRTMDWDLPLLKLITIELEFIKNKKTLFIAPTWVGCVGVFTAHRPGAYTIALNYRRTKNLSLTSLFWNLWSVTSMRWPASYLIRHVAETQSFFETTVHILQSSALVSPCYLTVFNNEKSLVITLDPDGFSTRKLDGPLYQTNCDHNNSLQGDNILWSRERCELIKNRTSAKGNNWTSTKQMLQDLLVHPILNHETVYISIADTQSITTFV
jgi:hypothetical protein